MPRGPPSTVCDLRSWIIVAHLELAKSLPWSNHLASTKSVLQDFYSQFNQTWRQYAEAGRSDLPGCAQPIPVDDNLKFASKALSSEFE